MEEFLYDLIADNALLGRQGFADQLLGSLGLRGGALIEGIDEDTRVQNTYRSFNSSLLKCRPASTCCRRFISASKPWASPAL